MNGGLPGGRSRKVLERADGSTQTLPSKCDHIRVRAGDLLHYVTWGGGGWGDPYQRDPELVALEVRRGLVTQDGAHRYGVVLAADGTVDAGATKDLRAQPRADAQVFDFGFASVDELRERCLAETGLPAPQPPVFGPGAAGHASAVQASDAQAGAAGRG